MRIIMNASAESQSFQVFGNHFNLKPDQIKYFHDDRIANFIVTERRDLGLVELPTEFEDPSYAKTDEGMAVLAEKKKEGVAARVNRLRQIIYNNQVSLKRDLEQANIKVDPKAEASVGEIAAMEELLKYQSRAEDETDAKIKRLKELELRLKAQ